ncbi:MAG: PEGA domain-containing protein [Spirochaetales bacterium]|nr:PEGA domain-containing protein [Spirochaetales bacterium]
MKRRNHVFLLILLFSALLWADDDADSADAGWTCAVTAFSGNLEEENHFLYRQIPLQIYHEISLYEEHILAEEEILALQNEDRESSRIDLLDEWESLHEERDALIFEEDEEEYLSLTEEIEAIRGEYEEEIVTVEKEYQPRSIEYISPGSGGILYNSLEEAREADPDFIVTGTMDDAGGFILIELSALYVGAEKEISLWTGAGKTEELDRMVLEMTDALKGTILGREWSALEVSVDPLQAQIFLNGRSLGVGAVAEETLEPGSAVLEVRLPRYGVYREEVELTKGERLVRNIVLEPGEEDLITIETEPAGADVILGSHYRGQTPLILPRPLIPEKLILSLEGYDTLSADLGPESPGFLSFPLTAGGVDWEAERLARKDKFYNSLGWFSLSVAGPLISYGVWQNYAVIGSENMSQAAVAYYSTLTVSGVLMGVSITRLVQYIKASEQSIEQR